MTHARLSLLAAAFALLSACTTPTTAPPTVSEASPPPAVHDGQLAFALASGIYHCDRGARVEVLRDPSAQNRIHIVWTGRQFELERNLSHSGLPRYEDATSGLVWIDLPWKSVLLDGQHNKPLASECKPGGAA